jgi:lipid II:glycine glycyltransferase (peptidoglycan interpeptide bridge formation enzyme)
MCTHHSITDWLPFKWNGFSQTTRYTYIIDYQNMSINDLWNNLDTENRRIIKNAYKNGLTVKLADDFDLVYHYESLTYERQGLKFNIPYTDLKSLDDAIKTKSKRVVLKVVDKDEIIHAVVYAVFSHKSAYGLLSGSDASLRKLGGPTLIVWETIKHFSDKVEHFNLGGSDIKRLEAHLRGFGGTLTPYFHIYNEKFAGKRDDLRFHLKESLFHVKEIFSIIRRKTFKTILNR